LLSRPSALRERWRHRLQSLPDGVTDPNSNLPRCWEVWDEGGTYVYYNVAVDDYDRPTNEHPFYGDVRTDEAKAADSALEALAGVDDSFTPALGGRVDAALPDAPAGAWDAPAESYTPRLGDRVDAALDALASEPAPYVPQLGGRVDDALDALAAPAGEAGAPEAAWGTEWAEGPAAEAPEATPSSSRALDLFASALTDEQLADAGLGEASVNEADVETFLDIIEEPRSLSSSDWRAAWVDERLGEVPSHELIEVDDDGDPITEATRMTYVDEETCVGCTLCAGIAPQTFQMTDDHGRARVFSQEGDDEETITEAISTCPVSCIHFVPWDELVALESSREDIMTNYNFKARLVGNDASVQSGQISTNSMLRCNNCPSNECVDCPMFGVGDRAAGKACGNCPTNGCAGCPLATEYPEFSKVRARRDRKRRQLVKMRKEEAAENLGLSASGGVEL